MGKITYKQLADELGVSKDKVKYQARKLPPDATEKVDGIVYLTELGADQIRKALGTSSESPVPAAPADMTALLQATLDTLQKQLTEKDALIKQLQGELEKERQHSREQSDKLAVLVDQAQHLQAMQGQKQLPAPKKSFFGLFQKKGE